MNSTAPKPSAFPPLPDSPWNDDVDSRPPLGLSPANDKGSNQILKDLEDMVDNPEWQANALKNYEFTGSSVKPVKFGSEESKADAKKSSSPPVERFGAMKVAPGKRQRLK